MIYTQQSQALTGVWEFCIHRVCTPLRLLKLLDVLMRNMFVQLFTCRDTMMTQGKLYLSSVLEIGSGTDEPKLVMSPVSSSNIIWKRRSCDFVQLTKIFYGMFQFLAEHRILCEVHRSASRIILVTVCSAGGALFFFVRASKLSAGLSLTDEPVLKESAQSVKSVTGRQHQESRQG